MTDERSSLRKDMRASRRSLPAAARIAGAESLADQLLSLKLPERGHVAGYWAVDGEIGLHAWQMRLPAEHIYCLPVLHEDGCLRFAPWCAGAVLVTNRHGIPEPDVSLDQLIEPKSMMLVIAPLVAFDGTGARLGMGAGWYDRSFAFRIGHPAPPHLVGAAFALQEVDALVTNPWDVPLDAVCTESKTVHPSTHGST